MNNDDYEEVNKVIFLGKNLILSEISAFIVLCFPLVGGLLYIAGSIVFWPTLTDINPNTGGILFIIGSAMYLVSDFASSYLQPEFSFHKPLQNVGSFKSLCFFVGNISFTIGSIYFLADFPALVGQDLFVIGSIFQYIPQVMSIWGVCSVNNFTAPYYIKMIRFKGTVIVINICLAGGCTLFFIGSFLFENSNIQSSELLQQGVIMFIVGSFLYFITPIIGLRMRKQRILDPLIKHHEEMVNKNFFPLKKRTNLLKLLMNRKIVKRQKNQVMNLEIQMQPSIGMKQQNLMKEQLN